MTGFQHAEHGYTALVAKDNGEYRLPRDQFAAALAAWMKGEAYFDAIGINGEHRVIRLGAIESIAEWSPEAIADRRAEIRAAKAEEALG